MEYLWTPWRMSYISGAHGSDRTDDVDGEETSATEAHRAGSEEFDTGAGCVFCDRSRLPVAYDRESLIVWRGEHNFVILNLYPYNSAHLMVVPFSHTADLPGLPVEVTAEMMALAQRMVSIIREEYRPEGFNLGMNLGRSAGAGVADHLHLHVVPRWAGDTNFMPVVGSTKVMPELLERTWERLRARLA